MNKLLNWRFWLGLNPKQVSVEPIKDYEITVLIPAYNEEASIQETIDSIKAQTIPIKEIIVIDDFSKDRTGEIARANNVRVIRTEVNQGTKAKAQDYVLSKNFVTTELVVTIDGDTLLHKDAIKNTLKYFNDPKTASVCGMVIPAKIKTLFERGRFIEYLFGIGLAKSAQNHVGAVLVSSGCFSVFRTELISKMGGFKARTMAEDMDCLHLKDTIFIVHKMLYVFLMNPIILRFLLIKLTDGIEVIFKIFLYIKEILKEI